MKIPGMTTSPKPSIVNPCASEKVKDFGQSSLMGMSSEVATLTITSVPNTHQISYRNREDNKILPVWKESIFIKDSALCEKDKERISVIRTDLRFVGEKE